MKIKGAIFDMDGTIIDSLMFWGEMWRDIGKRHLGKENFSAPESLDLAVRTMLYPDALELIRTTLNLPVDREEFLRYGVDGLVDFYKNVATVKPGAIELLEHLKKQGIRLSVASATDLQYVRMALTHHGLIGYFESLHSCAELGAGKDKPDVYLKAVGSFGLTPGDVCVFEDSYVAIETARSIGCKTVGLFDRYNFGQDRLRASSDIYMSEGEDLTLLIDKMSLLK